MKNIIFGKIQTLEAELQTSRDKCVRAGRQPSVSERQRAGEIMAEIKDLEEAYALEEKFEARDPSRQSQRPPMRPPLGDGGYRPTGTPGGPALDRTFKGMFPGAPLDRGGFKNQDEFLEVLNSRLFDPRLVRAGFTEGTPSEGGFSVPVEFSAQWLDLSLVNEVVRPLAQVWPMQSATRLVPGWDLLDMSAGKSFGGLEMEWLGEEGAGTNQKGKLRAIELSAKRGAVYCQASNQLVADGLGFTAQLQMALTGTITYGFDKAFLRGTGAGQPLGVLSATNSLITVNKESAQLADTIVYENLANMWARMYDAGKTRCVWVASSSIVPQLFTMGITLGVGGAPVFMPAGGASGSPYSTLFGRPLMFSPVMSALGDLFDLALVDFTQYAIGLRKEMAIDRSQAPGWTQDLDSWRIITRVDGMPTWNDVFKPEHGATQSWAVTLQAR